MELTTFANYLHFCALWIIKFEEGFMFKSQIIKGISQLLWKGSDSFLYKK